MKKILFVLFLLSTLYASGQNQTIDPTVEVNRDFEGKIMEIAKGKLNTVVADSIANFNIDFNYSFFNRKYRDLYEFSPLPSANINEKNITATPEFMAKAGIGIPFSPEAAIWYEPKLQSKKDFVRLGGNWNYFSKDSGKEHSYEADGDYTRIMNWGRVKLAAGLGGGEVQTVKSTASFEHSFTQFMIQGDITPKDAKECKRNFNWGISGKYMHTRDESSGWLDENFGAVKANFSPTAGRYSMLNADIEFIGVEYDGTCDYHYGVFDFTPQYKYQKGDLSIGIGIKLSGEMTSRKDRADKYHNFIFPAIDLTLKVQENKLWIYGNLSGRNNMNMWSSLLALNRYINPTATPLDILPGSTPLLAEGGLKGRFSDRFSYRLYAKFAIHHGLLQFEYDKEGGWYNAFNADHNEVGAGGEFAIKADNFRAGGNVYLSNFSNADHVCGKPRTNGVLYATYTWGNTLSAGIECSAWGNYRAALKGNPELVEISGNSRLDLNVTYTVNPTISIYFKGENLLNAPSVQHPFHKGKGACATGGIIVKL